MTNLNTAYRAIMREIAITHQALMDTVPELDEVRNANPRTPEQKARLTELLKLRKPIETRGTILRDISSTLWDNFKDEI